MAYKTVRDNVEELILILSEMEKEFLSKVLMAAETCFMVYEMILMKRRRI
jgi:hypothetical protein